MEQDKLTSLTPNSLTPSPSPIGEGSGMLVAEEGASLSSGSLRLYYLLPSPIGEGPGVRPSPLSNRRGAGGEAIGAIDLYNYDPLNRRCAVGIMVATEHRRQGHALAMLHALEDIYTPSPSHPSPIGEGPGVRLLYADIAATNTASIALFKKAGYEECGHFKEWLLVGDTYIDTIRMQLILKDSQ
ncbi:MAG: GNAT family N-acetyltransferase [Bacteroidales bacterium]|nr:GNAT family N-acetyltransferase [Bacteroidales bacterium]